MSPARSIRLCVVLLLPAAALVAGGQVPQKADSGGDGKADAGRINAAIQKGVQYLRSKGQAEDGSFSKQLGPGVSGVVLTGLLRSRQVAPADPIVTKGLKYLESFVQPDGAVATQRHQNYTTSVALMAFAEANRDHKYDTIVGGATKYLKGLQWDESKGFEQQDPSYGGAGYDPKSRPDLSNTAFALEALRSAGLPPDDPYVRKAIVFLSRCQNLESEFNELDGASEVNDGGFTYVATVARKPDEKNAEPRASYASMTYAGLQSMIYAGLTKDDPRVKAATNWIRQRYTLDENPGLPDSQQGLYYYYQYFGKTMSVLGEDPFVDAKGVPHDWRRDLADALIKRQRPDGSWVNSAKSDRWYEGDPNLVTGYALMALSYLREPAPSTAPGKAR